MSIAEVDPFVIERLRAAMRHRELEIVYDRDGVQWHIMQRHDTMIAVAADGRYIWEIRPPNSGQ